MVTDFQPRTLAAWIEHNGIEDVAKIMKVGKAAVRHWRRGFVLPHSDQMLKIKRLTGGRLTTDKIIEHHFSAANRKNRRVRK